MKRVDIVSIETGEVLGTVTTRYNSIETLFDNVSRWMRRHREYASASGEAAERGWWDEKTYYVKKVTTR